MNYLLEIFFSLFYPWLNCVSNWAYYEYVNSALFERRAKSFGADRSIEMFFDDDCLMSEYFDLAIKKHKYKVIFMPWKYPSFPEAWIQ